MNRKPGPSDYWHAEHARTCGGTFIKISSNGNVEGDKAITIEDAKDLKGKQSNIKVIEQK